jgi:Na+/H+ antiporter NhaB
MWLLVAGLAGAMVFFSVQYFRSFGRVKKAQKDLEEVQAEFDQHRKNALERERKLKRELIDAQMGKN